MRFPILVTLVLAVASSCLDGCGPSSGGQPSGVSVIALGQQPLVGSFASAPASLPYTAPPGKSPRPDGSTEADPAASNTASPSGFRDEFEGEALDSGRWDAGAQKGLITVAEGHLDLLGTGIATSFPYVVSAQPIVPEQGPFFVEWSYKVVGGGALPEFVLDASPPRLPGDALAAAPFFKTGPFYAAKRIVVEGRVVGDGAKGVTIGLEHVFRVEWDAKDFVRVIFDHGQIGAAALAKKRPKHFYVGPEALKDGTAITWGRIQINYVAAGPLTTPDSATPPPTPATPTPKPAATATPKPAVTTTPTAVPTTGTTATPTPLATPTPTPTPSPTATPTPTSSATPTPTPSATLI